MAAEPVEIPQEIASLIPANLVPTNLPGVYAVRPPAGTFDPSQASQAELRAQGIFLPRPGAGDPPAAHDLWEQAFPRAWSPQDWIVPVFGTGPAGTHLLKQAEKVENGSLTSEKWSGGILSGTWNAAAGTWNVPQVGASALPKDAAGGWHSSSWVGLDGYLSTDVLQAGVAQDVDATGAAKYYAWYEWYAPIPPACLGGLHLRQRPDPHAEPHDGKGQLTSNFPAEGRGNCAEWIVETPLLLAGKSLASLPRFSPVYFTGATAVPAPGITNPPPTSKDTINITRDGHGQTVSAYGDGTVTVTYVGIGWYPIHPEATFDHARQHVSAVSRDPGSLDLLVIGIDDVVHWLPRSPGGWAVEWQPLSSEVTFDHTSQQIEAVARTPGDIDVFVIGGDNIVR